MRAKPGWIWRRQHPRATDSGDSPEERTARSADALDPDTMATFAARYGAQVDFERTLPIVERHGLKF